MVPQANPPAAVVEALSTVLAPKVPATFKVELETTPVFSEVEPLPAVKAPKSSAANSETLISAP